jgi:hypothetical protein
MPEYKTVFGSLTNYEKGGVEIINDQPQNYVFSNFFEVANGAKPWEKVAIAKNMEYVIEAIRAEGVSPWRMASHDEFCWILTRSPQIRISRVQLPSMVNPKAPRWVKSWQLVDI